MRHTAKRSGGSCGESQRLSFGGSALRRPKRNTEHDRIAPSESGPEQDGDEEPEQPSSGNTNLHAQSQQHAKMRAEEQRVSEHAETNTWVSTWTSKQLVETAKTLTKPRLRIAQVV